MAVAVIFSLLVALSALLVVYKIYTRKKPGPPESVRDSGVTSTEEGERAEGEVKEESGDLKEEARDQAEEPQRGIEEAASGETQERQGGKELEKEPEATEETERESLRPGPDHNGEDVATTEDEQQRVEEKSRDSREEAPHGAEDARAKRQGERRKPDPEQRGGRPRKATQGHGKQQKQETKPRRPKPEVVSWKRERHWILALEIPDEFLGKSALSVLQNGSPLTQDETEEWSWRLKDAFGQVDVCWNEGGSDEKIEIALGQNGYLLLKLSSLDRGRCVKNPSFGSYLVVVPESLERDETLSGPPPAAPEPTSIPGYRGHYFDLERGNSNPIAFHGQADTRLLVNPNMPRFELVGSRFNDASEEMGPLFGDRPPQIRDLDQEAWKDVETIVVGEEGPGKGKWRLGFSPVLGLIEQDIPSELTARKGGWYFLRFYDGNYDLLESLDFRFVGSLKGIKVHQSSAVPLEGRHTAVSVEFFHESDCRIQPADDLAGSVLIERKDSETILTIPPDPTTDKTRWPVCSQNSPPAEVMILVERIWWALGEENEIPSEWRDTCFTLSRDDFAAISNKAIWVRLPRPRWIDAVSVGFDQPKSRRFAVKVTENTVSVPLRDFADSQEVGDRLHKHHLMVWIKRNGRSVEGIVAVTPGEVPESNAEGEPPLNLNLNPA